MRVLRRMRKDLGVRQKELAFAVGCCRQHLGECEVGTKVPSPELRERIRAALTRYDLGGSLEARKP